MVYRAEYINEESIVIVKDSHEEAMQEAYRHEEENGILWNVYLLVWNVYLPDKNYNDIEGVF